MIPLKDNSIWMGVVEDVMDPLMQGRLRVRIAGVHTEDKTQVPTSALPWSRVWMPINSASISGIGHAPVGVVQGSMVAGVFIRPESKQDVLVLWSCPGERQFNKSPKQFGFNDPQGIYPIIGAESDVSPWAQGYDVQDNPMENTPPVNDEIEGSVDYPDIPDVTGKYFSISDFFMGRDKAYPNQLTDEVIKNAETTTKRVNAFLDEYYKANPNAPATKINSGWRPPAVNSSTPGAASRSNHIIGAAADLADATAAIDKWAHSAEGTKHLERIGLWMEHMNHTPRWAHFQIFPPRSGNRHFRI